MNGLDFEKPIKELEKKIEELRSFHDSEKIDLSSEIKKLEVKLSKLKVDVYTGISPWQRVQLARHPERPYTLDYIKMIFSDFVELHGERAFADDKALVSGLARVDKHKCLVIGHQKGRGTKENLYRNFGCAHPEGYRKAIRLMKTAAKYKLPVVIFIDTPGAYPGIGAEERGQAQAIAENMQEMSVLRTPIMAYVIGEGGSGGALGIGVADKVCVFENAYYSVISPEGCAAILWKNGAKAPDAAEVLKLTAFDLKERGIIDEVVPEPLGGAHRDHAAMANTLKEFIMRHITELKQVPLDKLLDNRYLKFRRIGAFQ